VCVCLIGISHMSVWSFVVGFADFLPVVGVGDLAYWLIINVFWFCWFVRCFLLSVILTVDYYFSFYFKKKVRNVEEIKSTILLALFHFFCNIKPLNIAEYSQLFCLEKKKNFCAIWWILFLQRSYQKKRKFFVNRSADKKVALRCFPSATGDCVVLVFWLFAAAIWLFVMGWGLEFHYLSFALASTP